jgi:hypothetical protein
MTQNGSRTRARGAPNRDSRAATSSRPAPVQSGRHSAVRPGGRVSFQLHVHDDVRERCVRMKSTLASSGISSIRTCNSATLRCARQPLPVRQGRNIKGVPLLEDILASPVPPVAERSRRCKRTSSRAGTVFPTLIRPDGPAGPAMADLIRCGSRTPTHAGRHRFIDTVFDVASERVDEFLEVPNDCRRRTCTDAKRSAIHPNGYRGPDRTFIRATSCRRTTRCCLTRIRNTGRAEPEGPVYNRISALAPHPQYGADPTQPGTYPAAEGITSNRFRAGPRSGSSGRPVTRPNAVRVRD